MTTRSLTMKRRHGAAAHVFAAPCDGAEASAAAQPAARSRAGPSTTPRHCTPACTAAVAPEHPAAGEAQPPGRRAARSLAPKPSSVGSAGLLCWVGALVTSSRNAVQREAGGRARRGAARAARPETVASDSWAAALCRRGQHAWGREGGKGGPAPPPCMAAAPDGTDGADGTAGARVVTILANAHAT